MQKELIILDEDKVWAKARIAELEKAIQDLGPEFYEVFNQSSETWHDNAPFDALRDRQSVLDAELQQLKTVLRNSLPSVPRQKKNVAGIGSKLTIGDKQYFIAGDWTPYAGQEKDGMIIISAETPLAQQLLGKKIGDMVAIGRRQASVQAIE
jgi:transcription elongation GreA/GreB family factor